MKYGIHASSGGGRSSARETIARVAAGAVAEKWLAQVHVASVFASLSSTPPPLTGVWDVRCLLCRLCGNSVYA